MSPMRTATRISGEETVERVAALCRPGTRVVLTARALWRFVERRRTGTVGGDFLGRVADLLEHDNVTYDEGDAERIARVLFELSSPEINGAITDRKLDEFLSLLNDGA